MSACGGSAEIEAGGDSVSASELEAKATQALTKSVGQAPASIDCPSDLDAKAGETETCTLTDDKGNEYDMTATITSVSGGTAEFDFKVADQPK